MLSEDLRNLARALAALCEVDDPVTVPAELLVRTANGIDAAADRAEAMERMTVPATARIVPIRQPGTVIPFSKPWNGHPPGSDNTPPGGGGDAA